MKNEHTIGRDRVLQGYAGDGTQLCSAGDGCVNAVTVDPESRLGQWILERIGHRSIPCRKGKPHIGSGDPAVPIFPLHHRYFLRIQRVEADVDPAFLDRLQIGGKQGASTAVSAKNTLKQTRQQFGPGILALLLAA